MKERGSVELGHVAHASAWLVHLLGCTDMDMQVIFSGIEIFLLFELDELGGEKLIPGKAVFLLLLTLIIKQTVI